MHDYQEAMLKSLVAVAWADGQVSDHETGVIEALISAFEIQGDDADRIREYAKTKRTIDDVPLTELSAPDRRMLLQHAVILTYIDGVQTAQEKSVLDTLAHQLRIPDVEAKDLLEQAELRARRLIELL